MVRVCKLIKQTLCTYIVIVKSVLKVIVLVVGKNNL